MRQRTEAGRVPTAAPAGVVAAAEVVLSHADAPRTAAPAIRVEGLIKRYGAARVVDGLSFTVAAGEIFALLGRNGAGKTTTIEILEGYRARDGGQVEVLGQDPRTSRTLKQRVGLMLQQGSIYPNITVNEALRLFCGYYQRPADPGELLRLIGLEEKAGARFKTLSGGQKQRLSLGLALAGTPDLVFLDEPTAALDPQARLTTWEVIAGLRKRGVTVLLTTHYLEEAQRLADRVAIIDRGTLLALGTPEELMARLGRGAVRFAARAGLPCADLAGLPGAAVAREERPGHYVLEGADPDELLIEVALWSRTQDVRVGGLHVERASLEEVFLALTREGP